MSRNIIMAAAWFILSTIITWWFIMAGATLYHFDMQKMMLSCSIAGGKWGLQIIAAWIFLPEKRWEFIRRIGFTCFAGSCVLLPFCFGMPAQLGGINSFFLSLVLSVSTMLILYYLSVRNTGLPVKWYLLWITCLCIAVSLQLTVVFHVI